MNYINTILGLPLAGLFLFMATLASDGIVVLVCVLIAILFAGVAVSSFVPESTTPTTVEGYIKRDGHIGNVPLSILDKMPLAEVDKLPILPSCICGKALCLTKEACNADVKPYDPQDIPTYTTEPDLPIEEL